VSVSPSRVHLSSRLSHANVVSKRLHESPLTQCHGISYGSPGTYHISLAIAGIDTLQDMQTEKL